jgi:hypothetical protein
MANPQMDPRVQNQLARQNLLMTGIQMTKQLPAQVCPQNTVTKIPLLRMGIMTGVLLQFTVALTLADVATSSAKLSPCGPWNAIRRITYNDFAGVKRTNTSAFQLYLAQNFKMGDAQGAISPQPLISATTPTDGYSLYEPTNHILNSQGSIDISGVLAENTSAEFYFSLYVPMAYDPSSDLTGAILTQTNVGEHYIEVDVGSLLGPDLWANMMQGTNAPVISASTITVEAFQQYIQPQNMTADNLPIIDLSTVYGFEGSFETTANIQSNMDSYINYPNNRSIMSALVNFQDNNAFDPTGADLNRIVLLANSNTNFREMTPRYIKEMMRNLANFDAPGGAYFFPSRRQPILTQLYANVQLQFSVGTLGGAGTTKFISQYEVQYASGAPLPGITISA